MQTTKPEHERAAGSLPDAAPDDAPGEDALDDTLCMDDAEWLEHALGDIHSSAWLTPSVEL